MKKLIAFGWLALVPTTLTAQEEVPDLRKFRVEEPIKALLAPAPDAETDTGVLWHADLDAARTAAAESGKPILLFQLLGRLDDEFC